MPSDFYLNYVQHLLHTASYWTVIAIVITRCGFYFKTIVVVQPCDLTVLPGSGPARMSDCLWQMIFHTDPIVVLATNEFKWVLAQE